MLPLILDPAKATILVIGDGPATARRIELLKDANALFIHYTLGEWNKKRGQQAEPFSGEALGPSGGQKTARGQIKIIFIADLDDAASARLYHEAKAAGCLVNVEDKREFCDFHMPAIVRRGDLLLTVSTNAASPRLARRIRMFLEKLFPPVWAERVAAIRQHRDQWKKDGATFAELAEKTDALLDEEGWLRLGTHSPLEGESQSASAAQRDAVRGKSTKHKAQSTFDTPHDSSAPCGLASSAPPQGGNGSAIP